MVATERQKYRHGQPDEISEAIETDDELDSNERDRSRDRKRDRSRDIARDRRLAALRAYNAQLQHEVDSRKRNSARIKRRSSKHITCRRTSVANTMRCSNEACGAEIRPKRHRFYRKWHSLATIISYPFSPSLC